jgi:hypothetical protein
MNAKNGKFLRVYKNSSKVQSKRLELKRNRPRMIKDTPGLTITIIYQDKSEVA